MANTNMRQITIAIILTFLLLPGCGKSGLSGTYSRSDGEDGTKITFSSGDKAELDLGITTFAGTYAVEGKTVKITIPTGQVYAFTIDDNGCLVSDNMLVGKAPLCKNGSSSKAADSGDSTSRTSKSADQLKQIGKGILEYSYDNKDYRPSDHQALNLYLEGKIDTLLQSPYGPVHDGIGDYFLNLGPKKKLVPYSDEILAYDRAMLKTTKTTVVLRGNLVVDTIDESQFLRLAGNERNSGVDFKIPK